MRQRWLGALQFLTVLPVKSQTAPPGKSASFFPIIGALLGASAAAVFLVANAGLGRGTASLLAVVWLAVVTGCLHEDGLADVADAVRAGRSREKMLLILKDSRIGTYGAIALIFSVAVRWQALAASPQFSTARVLAGLTAAVSLSRFSLVALAASSHAAGAGLGQAFIADCGRGVAIIAAAQVAAIVSCAAIWIGWRSSAAMFFGTLLVVLLARVYFTKRLGGVTGDCLGAACQIAEMTNLTVLAWQPFS